MQQKLFCSEQADAPQTSSIIKAANIYSNSSLFIKKRSIYSYQEDLNKR